MDANNMANLRRMAPTTEAVAKLKPIAEFLPAGCGYDYVPTPIMKERKDSNLCSTFLKTHAGIFIRHTNKK